MGTHFSFRPVGIPRNNGVKYTAMFLLGLGTPSINRKRGRPQEFKRIMQGQQAFRQKAIMRSGQYCGMKGAVLTLLLHRILGNRRLGGPRAVRAPLDGYARLLPIPVQGSTPGGQ